MGFCLKCNDGKLKHIIGKRDDALCVNHYQNKKGVEYAGKKKGSKTYVIAKVSKSRQAAEQHYRRLRDKYFEQHPVCEFPGCKSKKITLHHKRGRVGSFLTDKRFFCSLCPEHHRWVEEHPSEAKEMGLSGNRLDKFK